MDQTANRTGITLDQTANRTGITMDQTANRTGITMDQTANRTGITMDQTANSTGITMDQTANRTGITMDQTADSTGITMDQTANRTGITMDQTANSTGKTMDQTANRTGITMDQTANSSGVSVDQTAGCSGVSVDQTEVQDDASCHEVALMGPGPEVAESMYSWKRCTKNPGHEKFIPRTQLSIGHLPPELETQLETIKALSELTVKMTVKYTSPDRPDRYAAFEKRGKGDTRFGTGLIFRVEEVNPCPDSTESESQCKTSYVIFGRTARHVLYNEAEAQCTTTTFFYDDEDCKKSKDKKCKKSGKLKSLQVSKFFSHCVMNVNSAENDWCVFACVTHDRGIYIHLKDALACESLPKDSPKRERVHAKLTTGPSDEVVAVVISHPHGQGKMITVGRWGGFRHIHKCMTSYGCRYGANTCPGSSGAPVALFDLTSKRLLTVILHSGFDPACSRAYSVKMFNKEEVETFARDSRSFFKFDNMLWYLSTRSPDQHQFIEFIGQKLTLKEFAVQDYWQKIISNVDENYDDFDMLAYITSMVAETDMLIEKLNDMPQNRNLLMPLFRDYFTLEDSLSSIYDGDQLHEDDSLMSKAATGDGCVKDDSLMQKAATCHGCVKNDSLMPKAATGDGCVKDDSLMPKAATCHGCVKDDSLMPKAATCHGCVKDDSLMPKAATCHGCVKDDSLMPKAATCHGCVKDDSLMPKAATGDGCVKDDSLMPKAATCHGCVKDDSLMPKAATCHGCVKDDSLMSKAATCHGCVKDDSLMPKAATGDGRVKDDSVMPKAATCHGCLKDDSLMPKAATGDRNVKDDLHMISATAGDGCVKDDLHMISATAGDGCVKDDSHMTTAAAGDGCVKDDSHMTTAATGDGCVKDDLHNTTAATGDGCVKDDLHNTTAATGDGCVKDDLHNTTAAAVISFLDTFYESLTRIPHDPFRTGITNSLLELYRSINKEQLIRECNPFLECFEKYLERIVNDDGSDADELLDRGLTNFVEATFKKVILPSYSVFDEKEIEIMSRVCRNQSKGVGVKILKISLESSFKTKGQTADSSRKLVEEFELD